MKALIFGLAVATAVVAPTRASEEYCDQDVLICMQKSGFKILSRREFDRVQRRGGKVFTCFRGKSYTPSSVPNPC